MSRFILRHALILFLGLFSSHTVAQLTKLPGQFDISASGASNYSIPIAVPPGTAGMEPALSLEYSSQGGSGVLGLGWSLNGLPTIERCARTQEQDSVKGGVNFDANDRFCMSDDRLVAISGTYGSNNTEYRTEVDSFSKVVSYGTAGTGPQWFKVWTKTGQIFEFGNTSDSRLFSGSTVRTWHVSKISDTAGNYLTVTYNNDSGNGFVYPDSIDYTYNSGLSAYNSVEFVYTTRSDAYPQYEAGAMTKRTHRMTNIRTYEGANLIHDYQLSYSAGTSLRPSLITAVTLCDGEGTPNCLPTTTFTWPAHNDPINLTDTTAFDFNDWQSNGVQPGASIGDYNGDGLPDFLRNINVGLSPDDPEVTYWMSTAPGSWQSVTKEIEGYVWPSSTGPNGSVLDSVWLSPLPADLNADGFTDAIIDEEGMYIEDTEPEDTVYPFGPVRYSINLNDTTGELVEEESGNGGAHSSAEPFGDLNGDGRDDQLHLQASPNGAVPYYSDGDGTFTPGSAISGLYSNAVVFPGDFNGDGCMDILAQGAVDKIYFSCSSASVTVTDWVSSNYKIIPGDFNGDGNTDLVLAHVSSNALLKLSDGTNFVSTSFSGPNDWAKYQVQTGDFNGDGRTDLMLFAFATGTYSYGPPNTHKIYLSTGDGFVSSSTLSNPTPYSNLLTRAYDFDRDGATDVWIKQGSGNTFYNTAYTPMMITAISDGLGQTTSISYKRLNDTVNSVYTKGSSASYPAMDVIGGQYVVSQVQLPDGVGGTNDYHYDYVGAKYHQQGRGLLGFNQRIVTDPNGIVHTTTYKQDYPYIGRVESETQVKSGVTLASVTYTYQNSTPSPSGTGGQRRYVKLYQTVETSKDLNGTNFPTITTTYTYDSYGNSTDVVVSGSGGDTRTTTNVYTNDTTNWLLGRVTSTTTAHALTGKSTITRKASFTYNSTTGLLTQEMTEPDNSALRLTTDYGRDSYGNITTTTVSGTDITTRTTTDAYDVKGRFMVTRTNAESHVEEFVNDPGLGVLISYTDPNGLETTRQYDGFGRMIQETDPDGRFRDVYYDYCSGVAGGSASCTNHGAMLVVSFPKRAGGSAQSGPIQGVVYDKLGRVIAQGGENIGGTDWSLTETQYDDLGRVYRSVSPYFTATGATQYTTHSYDALGRVTSSVTYPDSSTTSYSYNGLTTSVTNGLNQETTTVRNSQGLIHTVTEEGATTSSGDDLVTTYDYNAIGDVVEIEDPAGNTITNTVDTRGRITQRVDPSLGTWTYQYDVIDQLKQQTDAKSQVSTYSFDKLGRLTQLVASGLTSTFTHDTATNGIGQLKEMATSAGNKRTHTYDSYGRPVTTTVRIDSTDYTYTSTYNSDGRLATVQYPSGYTVRYEYTNNQRYLQYLKEHSGGATLWTANARNAAGQYTQATLNMSSSFVVDRTYDAYGRIIDVEAGTSNSIADFTFSFDKLGNLTQRADLNESVTENFTYDSMNRLLSAAIVGGETSSVTYNSIGNIASKTRLGSSSTNTYTYPTAGSDPYAVSSVAGVVNGVTNPSFTYDSNGNMTAGLGRTVTWTSFNTVATVAEGGTTLTYTYDAEHQRIKQSDGTLSTLYLNDPISGVSSEYLSSVGGTWNDYLFVDGERIGIRNKTTSPSVETLRSFVHDHAGSVAVVVNSSGAVVERLAYDAWGRRRDVDGTEDPSGTISATTTRGYTDHEHLPDISLINMNARIYDPEIGRFMSADSIIPQAFSSQDLNRYSYVYNNPGSYTDPSGHCVDGCFATIKAVYDLVQNIRALKNLFDLFSSDDDKPQLPRYHRPGIAIVNEDTHSDIGLRDVSVAGDPNLGQNASLSRSLGGSKFINGFDSHSATYTQGGFWPYFGDRVMSGQVRDDIFTYAGSIIESGTFGLIDTGVDEDSAAYTSGQIVTMVNGGAGIVRGAIGAAKAVVKWQGVGKAVVNAGADITKRPSTFRKRTVQGAWDDAGVGSKPETRACPTCNKDVNVAPGQGARDWDVDHQPKWRDRNLENMSRKQVLDEYNNSVRLRCPSCNRADN